MHSDLQTAKESDRDTTITQSLNGSYDLAEQKRKERDIIDAGFLRDLWTQNLMSEDIFDKPNFYKLRKIPTNSGITSSINLGLKNSDGTDGGNQAQPSTT